LQDGQDKKHLVIALMRLSLFSYNGFVGRGRRTPPLTNHEQRHLTVRAHPPFASQHKGFSIRKGWMNTRLFVLITRTRFAPFSPFSNSGIMPEGISEKLFAPRLRGVFFRTPRGA